MSGRVVEVKGAGTVDDTDGVTIAVVTGDRVVDLGVAGGRFGDFPPKDREEMPVSFAFVLVSSPDMFAGFKNVYKSLDGLGKELRSAPSIENRNKCFSV